MKILAPSFILHNWPFHDPWNPFNNMVGNSLRFLPFCWHYYIILKFFITSFRIHTWQRYLGSRTYLLVAYYNRLCHELKMRSEISANLEIGIGKLLWNLDWNFVCIMEWVMSIRILGTGLWMKFCSIWVWFRAIAH